MTKIEKDALFTHLVFVFSCVLIILIPFGIEIGVKLFILVIIYNLLILIVSIWQDHKSWLNIWLFVFLISIFQIWPDWVLSAEVNVLVFPEDGLFKIGTVSGYMAGLWVIPLFLIVFIGQRLQERYSKRIGYLSVVLMSLLIFGLSEQLMWMLQSWYAQNVVLIGHIALYIIIPEIILGLSSYYFYDTLKERNYWYKLPAAFIVMVLYLGSAIFFYFLIERVLFP
ncbi:MAG: hypothetical protein KGD58_15745 [Candidatus Lokiarchaeota archaeon]|nr:hypothetical protein [Candidatus Lokiarchaeota archaeon]